MTIERKHVSARMSQIVIHRGIVYLAGQVGTPDQSCAEQTRETLAKIDSLLLEAGSDKEHILRAEIWVRDDTDFAEMNEVWDTWVSRAHPPARATGQVRVGRPGLRVEIIVTAAKV